jgi:hypothetical protein
MRYSTLAIIDANEEAEDYEFWIRHIIRIWTLAGDQGVRMDRKPSYRMRTVKVFVEVSLREVRALRWYRAQDDTSPLFVADTRGG